MSMPRNDACLAFYQTLRARLVHLLPRLYRRTPTRPMEARRALAQLDAILCHLVEFLDRDGIVAEAIATCITGADLCAIGEAIKGARDDPLALSFRLHHIGLAGLRGRSWPHGVCLGHSTPPHVAFETLDLDAALDEAVVLVDPFEPFDGHKVAVIDDGGLPIELIEVATFGRTTSRRLFGCGMSEIGESLK